MTTASVFVPPTSIPILITFERSLSFCHVACGVAASGSADHHAISSMGV
jgi:hypothetical protein